MASGDTRHLHRAAVPLAAIAAGSPAEARRPPPTTIRSFRIAVFPTSEREVNIAIRVPRFRPLDVAGLLMVNRGATPEFSSHHLRVFLFKGEVTPALEQREGEVIDTSRPFPVSDFEVPSLPSSSPTRSGRRSHAPTVS